MGELSIGQVAARAGLRPSAIRYYESVGVLPAPRRVNGRRRYEPAVLARLAVVRMAQEAGFTIAEIRSLFEGFSPEVAAADRWRACAGPKIAEINALIARVQRVRDALEASTRCRCLTLDECAAVGWRDGTNCS